MAVEEQTKLLYLSNTFQYTSPATIIKIANENDQHTIILNQTIFYPQSGGQPSDIGTIEFGNIKFNVSQVKFNADKQAEHKGKFENEKEFKIGSSVILNINKNTRILNAKLHTAGHFIDATIQNMGLPLKGKKGYHFPEGPYVEFEGVASLSVEDLQKEIDLAQLQDLKIVVEHEEDYRFVSFGQLKLGRVGCGGTHLESVAELPRIVIRKIGAKKGNTTVKYNLE
jgi:Ser-tRNA(Ala) deacylase AlaX